jgi:hypothetical protein
MNEYMFSIDFSLKKQLFISIYICKTEKKNSISSRAAPNGPRVLLTTTQMNMSQTRATVGLVHRFMFIHVNYTSYTRPFRSANSFISSDVLLCLFRLVLSKDMITNLRYKIELMVLLIR